MEDNYSIDEILSAIDDLQNINKGKDKKNLKKNKTRKVSKVLNAKTDNSDIPKNTLKLIEEAEKSNN